jgi:ABC-type Na+ transport system ATPase subunit NatA
MLFCEYLEANLKNGKSYKSKRHFHNFAITLKREIHTYFELSIHLIIEILRFCNRTIVIKMGVKTFWPSNPANVPV